MQSIAFILVFPLRWKKEIIFVICKILQICKKKSYREKLNCFLL